MNHTKRRLPSIGYESNHESLCNTRPLRYHPFYAVYGESSTKTTALIN